MSAPGGSESFDANSAYYLLDHPDLHYVPTTVSTMNSVIGAIKFVGGSTTFELGRVVTNKYAYLGKIRDQVAFNYNLDNGAQTATVSFEMLTCNSALTTGTKVCNNKIAGGRCLAPGEEVWSCLGCARLVFQADGNLVVYTKTGSVVWSSGTAGNGATRACMQADGRFVLYTAENVSKWSSTWSVPNTNTEAYAMIQDDGQFVVNAGGLTKFTTGNTAPCTP